MHILGPWSTLEPGEQDTFGVDFAAELGGASIVSTSWSCVLYNPGQANDPSPGSALVGGAFIANSTQSWQTVIGRTDGAVYRLEATVNLSDSRILKNWSLVPCSTQ